ncbi:MAG: cupin domain-containing protein [Bacteroidetes bacterium]|nr:cupin domain-containing protein [Bacteroidota bacterium]
MELVRWNKSKKPTLEELKAILAREGLDCGLYSDQPRMKYGRHKHPFDDFVMIVSGRMKIMSDTDEWILKPGDRLNIPMNTPHSAEILGRTEVQYLSAEK